MPNHPTPTALRIIRGNPSGRPLPDKEPEFADSEASPPSYLSDIAREQWERVAPLLRASKVLTEADEQALAVYCECFAQWRDANEQIVELHKLRDEVLETEPERGEATEFEWMRYVNTLSRIDQMLSRQHTLRDKAIDHQRKYLVEFGMTPSSRTRVQMIEPKRQGKKGAKGDDWDSL